MSLWLQASRAAAGFRNENGARPQPDPNGYTPMQIKPKLVPPQPGTFIAEGNITINPAQAGWIYRELGYEHNRKVSVPHAKKLAEYMRRGQWMSKSTIDFARLSDGRLILVNGHHRMMGQSMTGVDLVWNVIFHDCANDDEVKALYYRFDTEVRKRSASNIVSGVGIGEELGLTRQTATALFNASSVIANGLRMTCAVRGETTALIDDRLAICTEYSREAALMQVYLSKAPSAVSRKLRQASEFSVALATMKHQPAVASEFWSGLCEDDGLTKGDPRKTLLMDMQTRKGTGGLSSSNLMATAKAWNAFCAGSTLKIIKVTGHDVHLAGTPFVVTA